MNYQVFQAHENHRLPSSPKPAPSPASLPIPILLPSTTTPFTKERPINLLRMMATTISMAMSISPSVDTLDATAQTALP
ncbi:hypothetical protein sscle_10g080130 [Sclerotinia sclerotiorum 1980 UF-70]|uniref:Uncharacterized protein n=1 Tax=Sclerotinia sclerotiorum (strain ATCC 18683 / 1980 / Ss-1) TaxID=665079 RepID=A0A1D9QF50_SCLS1|nr:hypothetical protein sscle_10g080130 [Sclerotinia sclerotiorum 1980 UF-70]